MSEAPITNQQREAEAFRRVANGALDLNASAIAIHLTCLCGQQSFIITQNFHFWQCPNCYRVWESGVHLGMFEIPRGQAVDGEIKLPAPTM